MKWRWSQRIEFRIYRVGMILVALGLPVYFAKVKPEALEPQWVLLISVLLGVGTAATRAKKELPRDDGIPRPISEINRPSLEQLRTMVEEALDGVREPPDEYEGTDGAGLPRSDRRVLGVPIHPAAAIVARLDAARERRKSRRASVIHAGSANMGVQLGAVSTLSRLGVTE